MHADAPHETCGLRLFAKHLKQTLIKHVVIGNIVANAGQVYIRCLSLGLKFCHCCVMNNLALDIDLIKIRWNIFYYPSGSIVKCISSRAGKNPRFFF